MIEHNKQGAKDITGKRFGLLTAIEPTEKRQNTYVVWKMKCDCGNIHFANIHDLQKDAVKSCGCIGASWGNRQIETLLKENNIIYEKEKRFETCRNPKTNALLPFDFFVDNRYIVEYDGEQHFYSKAPGGWFSQEKLDGIRERDEYKNQWCKDNNIKIIRIPYTKKEIRLEDIWLID